MSSLQFSPAKRILLRETYTTTNFLRIFYEKHGDPPFLPPTTPAPIFAILFCISGKSRSSFIACSGNGGRPQNAAGHVSHGPGIFLFVPRNMFHFITIRVTPDTGLFRLHRTPGDDPIPGCLFSKLTPWTLTICLSGILIRLVQHALLEDPGVISNLESIIGAAVFQTVQIDFFSPFSFFPSPFSPPSRRPELKSASNRKINYNNPGAVLASRRTNPRVQLLAHRRIVPRPQAVVPKSRACSHKPSTAS